ncbi:SHOCT domain-containing protein [Arthrobacter oryzae]|uniref:SHOCT domain-containing protein n=1 Tax=Arthrobacter oryzae TaxID=409290 RepID=A0A3N0C083_9MICC|nr:SHOCT domain-containing protein [Arthrobacter oryzae]
MNQHAVSTESGGYIFAFSISRTWLRIAGLCAVAAGVIIAVVANATEPFRGPLGIAFGVLAITLLIAYTLSRSSRRQKLELAPPAAHIGGHQVMVGKLRRKKSLASELSLVTELHAKGALSDEEFSLAKRRLLGG